MKSVAKVLKIEANHMEGKVVFGVRSEAVVMRTFFRDLTPDGVPGELAAVRMSV